ncbi:uracil-DNA glycosylase [Rhodovulum adriaticum]|uniref:Type-4 uracil-DNA glycosylase n=1 Tax=Rhodovulum adriaticum TaxID=35804 RepID=A0A4R2NJT5_RHOAD|nr:uracil-DNA glycosylase [Rhodovulum adriaticum]MBK1635573.1 uracil-DNA glycosylase [Rhodovulum adriaticum]TCP21793.1 DNA polymerase [Rhodovulum adriaticum]
MESVLDHHTARALLDWQIELGATEAICDAPVNRYEAAAQAPAAVPKPAPTAAPPPPIVAQVDPVAVAREAAAGAGDLDALRAAMAAFEFCDLKLGARNLVFADGNPAARVMVIGEAPGRDEDIQGKPFVGRAGQLLDRMFAAIGMDRANPDAQRAVYITNVLPWRPPQNRDPKPEEVAMLLPFIERHVDLVAPDVLVLMGNISCGALLGRKGITRLRGNWVQALGRPALPMFHPAYLLRNAHAKREAWHDLLMLQAKLRGDG